MLLLGLYFLNAEKLIVLCVAAMQFRSSVAFRLRRLFLVLFRDQSHECRFRSRAATWALASRVEQGGQGGEGASAKDIPDHS